MPMADFHERPDPRGPILLHIPHSSLFCPVEDMAGFSISQEEMGRELLRMTDRYVDELFPAGYETVRFPVSRLICDVERYRDDEREPMAAVGMGALYTHGSEGQPIRSVSPERREALLCKYYDPHHRELARREEAIRRSFGLCLIVDCHSFPSLPLACDLDRAPGRPDFCIGFESENAHPAVTSMVLQFLNDKGYSVGVNRPYSGSMVPVGALPGGTFSIMIEINRKLYMNESTGEKHSGFEQIRRTVRDLLHMVNDRITMLSI